MDKKTFDILKKHYHYKLDKNTGKYIPNFITDEEVKYVAAQGYSIKIDDIIPDWRWYGGNYYTQITHNAAQERLLKAFAKVNLLDISNAFLYSLSTQDSCYSNALSAYVYAMNFPTHAYDKTVDSNPICKICGMLEEEDVDFTYQYYLRAKPSGFVGLGYTPISPTLELELFLDLLKVIPTNEDIRLFKIIIKAIENAAPTDRARAVQDNLKDILKGNKYTRQAFFETLGHCGILETENFKGFDKKFMTIWDRQGANSRPHISIECDPPLSFWTGKDGINHQSLAYFFPQIAAK